MARDGANVVIGAKTADPNPKLEGTIYSAAKEGSILIYLSGGNLYSSVWLISYCFLAFSSLFALTLTSHSRIGWWKVPSHSAGHS